MVLIFLAKCLLSYVVLILFSADETVSLMRAKSIKISPNVLAE